MKYEKEIKYKKSLIAGNEDAIIRFEKMLGGRGESSIITEKPFTSK